MSTRARDLLKKNPTKIPIPRPAVTPDAKTIIAEAAIFKKAITRQVDGSQRDIAIMNLQFIANTNSISFLEITVRFVISKVVCKRWLQEKLSWIV